MFRSDDRLEGRDDTRRSLGQRLIRLHHVEIVIRNYLKRGQNLVQHGTVLGGDAYFDVKLGLLLQAQQDRTELDCLGARSKD